MRLLLDTLTFRWAATGSERLWGRARDLIEDPANELLLSSARACEIAVKAARGHVGLPDDARTHLATRVATLGMREMPVAIEHAVEAAGLSRLHADPWDRLLVAQSRIEAVPIRTADRLVRRNEVETIW